MKKKVVLVTSALMAMCLLAGCGGGGQQPSEGQSSQAQQSEQQHAHDWGEATYAWSNDNSTCTAKRVCKLDDKHVETETVNSTYEVVEEAKCEADGKGRYTADFTKEAFADQTKDIVLEATGHKWGEATYSWSEDFATCTASKVCENDASHKVEETVNATKAVTKDATEDEEGSATYTATFTNSEFEKQVQTGIVPLLPALSKLTFVYHEGEGAYYSVKAKDVINISGKVTIPSTYKNEDGVEAPVTAIEENGFDLCREITYVDIPSSIVDLGGDRAFASCKKLATLVLHEGTQTISRRAFSSCDALTSVSFPASITDTAKQGFQSCRALETVTFAEGSELTVISSQTFQFCESLKELHVPSKVQYILVNGLAGCTALEKLTLPKTLTNLSTNAIADCTALEAIDYEGTKEEWGNIQKSEGWMDGSDLKTIRCTDGDITLG